jgi:hypothetical protein
MGGHPVAVIVTVGSRPVRLSTQSHAQTARRYHRKAACAEAWGQAANEAKTRWGTQPISINER